MQQRKMIRIPARRFPRKQLVFDAEDDTLLLSLSLSLSLCSLEGIFLARETRQLSDKSNDIILGNYLDTCICSS